MNPIIQQQVTQLLTTAENAIKSARDLIGQGLVIPPSVAPRPVREIAPAFDACAPFVEAAKKAGMIDLTKYGIGVFAPGDLPGYTGERPRMSQEKQDELEAEIRGLLASDFGKEWLSHNENAITIDRRYCYHFTGGENGGYTVKRLPDGELERDFTRAGPLPL